MKFYDIDSEFTFGKYEGKSIREVFEKDPKYIDFCFNNIDEFYVSPDVLKELRGLDPRFSGNVTENDENFDDDMFDSFLDEAGLLEDMEGPFDIEDDLLWDDEAEPNLDDEDNFDNFDQFDDEFDNDYDSDY